MGGKMRIYFCFVICTFVGALSAVRANPYKTPWVKGHPLPSPRNGAAAVVGSDDAIYIMGGSQYQTDDKYHLHQEPLRTVAKFDEEKGWRDIASMTHARFSPAAIAVDDHIYVFGGMGEDGVDGPYVDYVEKYNVRDGSWASIVAKMPEPRCCFSAILHGGLIYLYGGFVGLDGRNDWEVFDYNEEQWWTEQDFIDNKFNKTSGNAEVRGLYGLAKISDSSYLFFGGEKQYHPGESVQDIVKFDFRSHQFSHYANLPKQKSGAAVIVGNGEHNKQSIWVIGGQNGWEDAADSVIIFEPSESDGEPKPKDAANLNHGRSFHAAVLYKDTMHVIGGWGKSGSNYSVYQDVELLGLNPKTEKPEEVSDAEADEGRDRGWWIVFGIVGALALYFVVGIAIKYKQGARGGDVVPHREFWIELPSLVQEGSVIAFDFGRGVVQRFRGKREYRPLSNQDQEDEEAVDTSRLSARSSARGAYGGVTA